MINVKSFKIRKIKGQNTFISLIKTNNILITENTIPISPNDYVLQLKEGVDVDWAKTNPGIKAYNLQTVKDFVSRGWSHVRIRISNDLTPEFISHIKRIIEDCLNEGLIPIVAYQGEFFKTNPTIDNAKLVGAWWNQLAKELKDYSYLLTFNFLIEVTDELKKNQTMLDFVLEECTNQIRVTNPSRIIFISPLVRSSPEYLKYLAIPTKHNNYLMAEWHFYAAGPSKTSDAKKWTIGNPEEKKLITDSIQSAVDWQNQTGLKTWVGAWMPGNYNDGDDYSIQEQVVFSNFMSSELRKNKIPFAVNSDTKFYDRDTNTWIEEMKPVVDIILNK